MRRLHRHAIVAVLAALLGGCTAPAPQSSTDADAETETRQAPATSASTGAQRRPARPPRMSDPLPPQRVPGTPVVVDRSCRSDADCVVKDIGSCCGYFPACVNKDSPTDPAAVRAQCEQTGMASVCGFREITACTCNAGQCEAADAGAPVAQ